MIKLGGPYIAHNYLSKYDSEYTLFIFLQYSAYSNIYCHYHHKQSYGQKNYHYKPEDWWGESLSHETRSVV